MSHGVFVTGTDTAVGKTFIAQIILHKLKENNISSVAMKPIACGAQQTPHGFQNDDACKLQQMASVSIPYDQVNPYVFEHAIAPHLAAQQVGTDINIDKIKAVYSEIQKRAEYIVVEGVGGWLVPINNTQLVADLAVELRLPVVLVVGMRLGCLNHAFLTVEGIQKRNIELVGWVANCVDKSFSLLEENTQALVSRINAPLLGVIAYDEDLSVEKAAQQLNTQAFLSSV